MFPSADDDFSSQVGGNDVFAFIKASEMMSKTRIPSTTHVMEPVSMENATQILTHYPGKTLGNFVSSL